ncbi:hypothetical protein GM921_09580 [Pedobacter sp. LMG 31464]|uniref:DUF2116 family Zn-ribbon domain-containing protein n=1 Tax=Pedobacter planticolens TaxID=2679964 RepID=A0A923DZ47_9SPHI|nr:hypothetical protein [Pedobacter planticolens]MBB2145736.1 hypothetical protein [Pedobacter planticolens]
MASLLSPQHRDCAFCGKELFGRADKAYCNDTCRNNGNRERRKKLAWYEPIFIRQINNILKRNYKILTQQGIDEHGPKTVSRYKLLDEGFNFHYFTSNLSTRAGEYRFIYDYGWRELPEEKVMIVTNPKQVEI